MGIFSFIRRLMLVLSGPANDLVFLSFSNGDAGKNFSDHLNSALTRAGLRTFRNADDTRRGENTESETRKAIQESKISVIVFSKDYAFSTRCLDSVVMIMDAREATGHTVLPIFYHSDPSEVRNQEGRYFEAFSAHEECFQGEAGRVEEWRAALRKAADVAGMVLQDSITVESHIARRLLVNMREDIQVPGTVIESNTANYPRGKEFDENERSLAMYKRNEDIEGMVLDISKISFESKLNVVCARKSKLRLPRIYTCGVTNNCEVRLPHGRRQVPFLGDEISALG